MGEIGHEERRYHQLEQRAAEHHHELAERHEQDVSGLVEDEEGTVQQRLGVGTLGALARHLAAAADEDAPQVVVRGQDGVRPGGLGAEDAAVFISASGILPTYVCESILT